MKCSEIRERLLVKPAQTRALEPHLRGCRACAIFAEDLLRLDRQLAAAGAVPVPEGLVSRVLIRRQARRRLTLLFE